MEIISLDNEFNGCSDTLRYLIRIPMPSELDEDWVSQRVFEFSEGRRMEVSPVAFVRNERGSPTEAHIGVVVEQVGDFDALLIHLHEQIQQLHAQEEAVAAERAARDPTPEEIAAEQRFMERYTSAMEFQKSVEEADAAAAQRTPEEAAAHEQAGMDLLDEISRRLKEMADRAERSNDRENDGAHLDL